MMQMLESGGIPILTDGVRVADLSNPRGYYEYEVVKDLPQETNWLPDARGKGVKIISMLLYQLPPTEQYRILFMDRNLEEVLLSQEAMLQRMNRTAAPHAQMLDSYQMHLKRLEEWLAVQSYIKFQKVRYQDLIEQSREQSRIIGNFLGRKLDIDKMTTIADPLLYRSRDGSSS
jgi:hypothetical protein